MSSLNDYMKTLIRRRWNERQARAAAGVEMEAPDILERVLSSLDPKEFGEVRCSLCDVFVAR